MPLFFFFSSRRRHTRYWRDWSSDVCSSDLSSRRTLANLDEFVRERSSTWSELEHLLNAARSTPARLGPDGVRRLGACYRATAADLAFARRHFGSDPFVLRLEQLVHRGRQVVYHTTSKTATFREYVIHGYWRRVRERPAL